MRLDRLQQQAGSSMVTTNTLASMDEDDDSALKRFNLILKACSARIADLLRHGLGTRHVSVKQPCPSSVAVW